MPTPFEEAAGGNTPGSTPSLPALGDSSQENSGEQSVSLPSGSGEGSPPSPAPAAWDSLPRSWKKDYETHWGSLPPEVRQYIHTREEEVRNGISAYRGGHERWTKAIQPFESVLQQHPDVDPVQLVQVLAQNHLALVQGTPQQRKDLLLQVAKHYGVDFAQAANAASGGQPSPGAQPAAGFTPEQMQMLQQMLGPMYEQVRTALSFTQEQRVAEAKTSVDKFFSDPKNVYAEDVAQDMLQILQARKAETLEEAYELAIMRNPEVKARYLADLAAKANPGNNPPPATNLKSSPTPAEPPKPKTMDDTIDAVIRKHYGT